MLRPTIEGLQDELNRCPFHDLLDVQAVHADADITVVRLPFERRLSLAQDHDFFHGGVVASLVDITAHAALAMRLGAAVPTVDLRVDFLKPAGPPAIHAEARIIQIGRSIGRADVQVRNHDGAVVACGRGTFSTLMAMDRACPD